MKTFRITADATFEAETVDDAFAKISYYYGELAKSEHPKHFIQSGEVDIFTIRDEE